MVPTDAVVVDSVAFLCSCVQITVVVDVPALLGDYCERATDANCWIELTTLPVFAATVWLRLRFVALLKAILLGLLCLTLLLTVNAASAGWLSCCTVVGAADDGDCRLS